VKHLARLVYFEFPIVEYELPDIVVNVIQLNYNGMFLFFYSVVV